MGSLVKPFHLSDGAGGAGTTNAATVVQDAPVDVKLVNGKHWRPENFTHQDVWFRCRWYAHSRSR